MLDDICPNPNTLVFWHWLLFNVERTEKNRIFHWLSLDKPQEWHLVPFWFFVFSDGAVTSGELWIDVTYLPNLWKMGHNFTRQFISVSSESSYSQKLFLWLRNVLLWSCPLPWRFSASQVPFSTSIYLKIFSCIGIFCPWKCTFPVSVGRKSKFQWDISVPFKNSVWSAKWNHTCWEY